MCGGDIEHCLLARMALHVARRHLYDLRDRPVGPRVRPMQRRRGPRIPIENRGSIWAYFPKLAMMRTQLGDPGQCDGFMVPNSQTAPRSQCSLAQPKGLDAARTVVLMTLDGRPPPRVDQCEGAKAAMDRF